MFARLCAFIAAIKDHPLWLVFLAAVGWAQWWLDKAYGDDLYRWFTGAGTPLLTWIADHWVGINVFAFLAFIGVLLYRMWRESARSAIIGKRAQVLPVRRGAEITLRQKHLSLLEMLHEIGTHMLLTRPISGDSQRKRLEENRDWWELKIIENSQKAGASEQALRQFRNLREVTPLGGVPPDQAHLFGIINGKLTRLESVIDEVRGSILVDIEALIEGVRRFRDTVLSSVSVNHIEKTVTIQPLDRPKVTEENTAAYRAIKAELECLGYRVTGWPGDE